MKFTVLGRKLALGFAIVGSLFLVACGDSSSSSDSPIDQPELESTTTALGITRSTEFFGQGGNLWKPQAEEKSSTAGLLVVLLGSQHTGRFDSCELLKIDGTVEQLDCNDRVPWSHHPYSCVANGNREHWRASVTCDQAAMVRVVCKNLLEEVTFEGPGPAISAVCGRHG